MKLLMEIERLSSHEPLQRGEYHVEVTDLRIGCPECGGQNRAHRKKFNGRFECRFCKWEGAVKLTGERAR